MGLPPDLKVIAENMIKASMGLADTVMVATVEAAVALSSELARQHGMAGDDDAGAAFAKVYRSAASTTLDMLGYSAYVIGEAGEGLMRNAREFMARESAVASAILQRQVDLTYTMGDPGQACSQRFLNLGQDLPEVVGETSAWDQYAPAGNSDRFRGSPDKLRDVADSWRAGGKLVQRLLTDAQAYASTADKAHSGQAADAFHRYFSDSIGFVCPSDQEIRCSPTWWAHACNSRRPASATPIMSRRPGRRYLNIASTCSRSTCPGTHRCSGATATTAA
ncbi:hypothetical protein ACF06P_12685 [Streptomyces sp. NPDC015684]|uniref:hypothetical protein n=1 Tax=Streptomyces sp. NPDC015684 TaxID=3364963 RepID=UPI0036F86747